MALTLERLRQMDIPLNVSNRPNNLSAFNRKVAPYNDSVNLYEAIDLFITGGTGGNSNTNITISQTGAGVTVLSSTGTGDSITSATSLVAGALMPNDWLLIQSALQEVYSDSGILGTGTILDPLRWEGAYVAGPFTGNGTQFFPINILNNSITTAHIKNATILFGDWAQNGATTGQVPQWNGSAWVASSVALPTGSAGKVLIHNGTSWVSCSEITEYRTDIVNTVITLASTPLSFGKFQAYKNGVLQTYGEDYTRSDANVSLTVTSVDTDNFIFIYNI